MKRKGSLKSGVLIFALAVSGIILSSVPARAGTAFPFTFAFTNDPTFGNVPGTVTGEIVGLTDNATSAAINVLITGFPAGLNSVLGTPPPPIDAALWDQQYENLFTVVDGLVTAADFYAANSSGAQLYIGDQVGGSHFNFLNLDATVTNYVWNNNGLAGANIETPEPSSLLLLGTGLAAVSIVLRRKVRR